MLGAGPRPHAVRLRLPRFMRSSVSSGTWGPWPKCTRRMGTSWTRWGWWGDPALGRASAEPQTRGGGTWNLARVIASSGRRSGRGVAGSLRALGHSRSSLILTRLTLSSPKLRCNFLGWEGTQRRVPVPSGPGLGPTELFLLPTGTPVGFVAQSSIEAAAWGGPGPSAHAPPSPQAQASAPTVCPPASVPTGSGQWKGARRSFPAAWGSGGCHTHSTPPPRDVPDPQRSFLGPTGLSGSQAHQEPGTLGRGVWGSGQCLLRVSPGRGGWAGRRVGGVCWGRGLFWSAPPRFSTSSSSTPAGAVLRPWGEPA